MLDAYDGTCVPLSPRRITTVPVVPSMLTRPLAFFFLQISSNRRPVAAFDWDTNGDQLGVVTIGDREFPMEHLVLPGSCPK